MAVYGLARRSVSRPAALAALTYFLILPFAVQASRSFQPDPLMTASLIVGLYFMVRWSEHQRWRWALLGAAFLGLAVLVKIVIAFLVAGAAVAIVSATLGRRFFRSSQVWAMVSIMVAPGLGYYVLGHPSRSTEYFVAWTVDLVHLITSPHFYSDWLGFVGGLVGLSLLFISLVGVVLASPRFRWMLIGLWGGYVIYGLLLPFQMFTHSYYHLQLVPVIALGLATVAEALTVAAAPLARVWRLLIVIPLAVLAGYEFLGSSLGLGGRGLRNPPPGSGKRWAPPYPPIRMSSP